MNTFEELTAGWLVVPADGFKLDTIAQRDDLRVLDEEFDTGVKALFADNDDTIVAFLFSPGRFDEAKARAWVEAVEAEGVNMTLYKTLAKSSREFFAHLLGPMIRLARAIGAGGRATGPEIPSVGASLDDESFRQVESRVRAAVEDYYGVAGATEIGTPYPWIHEIFKEYAVVEYDGEYYRFSYQFGEQDEIVLGEPRKVRHSFVPAAIALKTVGGHRVNGAFAFPLAGEDRAWNWNAAKENTILDKGGWAMLARAHLAVEIEDGELPENKAMYHLPVAELINGRLHYNWHGARAARGALSGARGGVKLPQDVKDACMATVKALYKKFGKEDLFEAQMAVIFSLALSDAEPPAEVVAGEDGLIWKEIAAVGTTYRPADGEPVEIEQDFVDALHASFGAGVLDNVAITAEDHFYETDGIVPADATVGFVRKLKKLGGRLWAGLEVIKDEIREALGKTIKDVSIFAWPDFHDRRDGKEWPWVLVHLLFTNYPQLVGLAPFGAEPVGASAGGMAGARDYFFLQEVNMGDRNKTQPNAPATTEVAMTPADAQALADFRALNLSVGEIQAMQAEREATRTKARDLEISAVIAALEGRGTHEGVTALDGKRHYPVVVEAVESALRANGNEALALDVNTEGQSPLDAVVLAVVNAIPAEGRMVESQPPVTPAPSETPPVDGGEEDAPTNEQIENLDERI
jgi:hypothetical protein